MLFCPLWIKKLKYYIISILKDFITIRKESKSKFSAAAAENMPFTESFTSAITQQYFSINNHAQDKN